MSKKYPFKFLDAYGKDDTPFFFGRDEEINAMYQMIFQGNTLLVYGASGTGKTSLIQCGLASKFQSHDWLALYVRRESDINSSFEKAIATVTDDTETDDSKFEFDDLFSEEEEEHNTKTTRQLSPLAKSFKNIYLKYFRPIYLIFDQFEELFILGTKPEQQKFIETVQEILQLEQPVKMIFSMREEYLGYLYEFEKAVPQLLRKKLRVEPMNLDKVRQIIHGVTASQESNIHISQGEEQAITEAIFDKIKGKDKSLTIQLPYLQVFLDKLYYETTNDDNRQADAVFSLKTLERIGNIDDILKDFLENQVKFVSSKLSATGKKVGLETIWKILSPFATLEGTKKPLSMADLIVQLPDISETLITNTVAAFVNSRIMRQSEDGNIYELSHDALAGKIAGKRSAEEIALLEVKKIISSQVNMNKNAREFFTEKQLNFIEPYINKLTLDSEERLLVNESRKEVKRQRIRRHRFIRVGFAGSVVLLIIMGSLTYNAYVEKRNAVEARNEADSATNRTNRTLKALEQSNSISRAMELQSFGNSYWDNGNFEYARESYQAALDTLIKAEATTDPIYTELKNAIRKCTSMKQQDKI